MPNVQLATIAEAMSNISSALAECVRHDAQGSAPPAQYFEECLAQEVRRLRGAGEEGLAEAMATLRAPLCRLMTEGW